MLEIQIFLQKNLQTAHVVSGYLVNEKNDVNDELK